MNVENPLFFYPNEIGTSGDQGSSMESNPDKAMEKGELIRDFIATYRFDAVSQMADLLSVTNEHEISIDSVFSSWEPDLIGETRKNKGSDCFGLAKALQEDLLNIGEEFHIFPFNTEGLVDEAKDVVNDIGHVALFRIFPNKSVEIIDPGFSLAESLIVSPEKPRISYCSPDGRTFVLSINFEKNEGRMMVDSEYHPEKSFGFSLNPLSDEELVVAHKNYLSIRPSLPIDSFDGGGRKDVGIKLKLVSSEVVTWNGSYKKTYSFKEWKEQGEQVVSDLYPDEHESISNKIETVIRQTGQVRCLWVPSLEDKFVEKNGLQLRDMTMKEQEGNNDFSGAVIYLLDGKGSVALYRVPTSREKPHIDRFSGQLNTLVETKEGKENFAENVIRGLEEEVGESIEKFTFVEGSLVVSRYGLFDKGGVAGACVMKVNKPEDIKNFSFENNAEGGSWEWFDINVVLGKNLEPNMRPIFERFIKKGLIE